MMIEVRTSKISKGEFNRGVFATQDIAKGTLVHEAPVIPSVDDDDEHLDKTVFADYVFEYGANHTALLLGYGSLLNHSYTPNLTYEINFENHTFDFYAYRDIVAGEGLFINYNGEVDNMDPLWFMDDYEERMKAAADKEKEESPEK